MVRVLLLLRQIETCLLQVQPQLLFVHNHPQQVPIVFVQSLPPVDVRAAVVTIIPGLTSSVVSVAIALHRVLALHEISWLRGLQSPIISVVRVAFSFLRLLARLLPVCQAPLRLASLRNEKFLLRGNNNRTTSSNLQRAIPHLA